VNDDEIDIGLVYDGTCFVTIELKLITSLSMPNLEKMARVITAAIASLEGWSDATVILDGKVHRTNLEFEAVENIKDSIRTKISTESCSLGGYAELNMAGRECGCIVTFDPTYNEET
jgi:hypothetical protein